MLGVKIQHLGFYLRKYNKLLTVIRYLYKYVYVEMHSLHHMAQNSGMVKKEHKLVYKSEKM